MLSSEIELRLKHDKSFIGCFPYDQLPTIPEELPAKIIINTGASSTEGDKKISWEKI